MSRAGVGAAGARAAPPGSSVPGTLVRVALVATILVFVPGLIDQFEGPKAEVVRVCGLAALALVAASGRRAWGAVVPLDVAVALWLGVELLATSTSMAPVMSTLGIPAQREGLLTSLAMAGLYAAARCSAGEARSAAGALTALMIAAGIASLYALAQAAGIDPLPWRDTARYAAPGAFQRPFGTLGHPNLLGVVTAAALPVALGRLLAGSSRRIVHALAVLILALATLLAVSRAAWLGAAAGASVTLALLLRGRMVRAPGRAILIGAALAAATLAVVLVVILKAPVAARSTEALSGGSSAARVEIWRSAIAAGRARPILGHGPDTFELIYPRFQTAGYWRFEWGLQPFHAHSIVLHTFATRGIAGLLAGLAWMAALLLALRDAWRAGEAARLLAATLAGALTALLVSGGFGALGMSGALIAAVASGLLAGSTGVRPPAPAGRTAVAAGLIVALAALAWAGVELSAAWAAGEAREVLDDAPDRAASAAARAEALAPWDDGYARLHADALERAALTAPDRAAVLAGAERAARRAVALAPSRAIDHRRLGSVLAGRLSPGDSVAGAAAEASLRVALDLGPMDGVSAIELARLELFLGRPQAALAPARRAAALYPAVARGHALLAQALLALGDRAGARAELDRAMGADWLGDDAARHAAEAMRDGLAAVAPASR